MHTSARRSTPEAQPGASPSGVDGDQAVAEDCSRNALLRSANLDEFAAGRFTSGLLVRHQQGLVAARREVWIGRFPRQVVAIRAWTNGRWRARARWILSARLTASRVHS